MIQMQHIQDPFLVLEIVELFFAHDSAVDPPNEYHFNTHVILFLSLNIQLVVCPLTWGILVVSSISNCGISDPLLWDNMVYHMIRESSDW